MSINRNNFFVLCIDLEKFTLPLELGRDICEEKQYLITLQGVKKIRKLLRKWNIKSTFFTTRDIAVTYPDLVKSLAKEGHEIGLHYKKINNVKEEIANYKVGLEKIVQKKILGFKSHKFEYLSCNMLQKLEFAYHNSIHPTYVPGRYCNILKRTNIYNKNGIWVIPISVSPLLKLPLSWVWFRNFGINYVKFCTQSIYLTRNLINIYFHPWDFECISNYNEKKNLSFIFRNSGDYCINLLDLYIKWLKQKKVKLVNFKRYLEQNGYK